MAWTASSGERGSRPGSPTPSFRPAARPHPQPGTMPPSKRCCSPTYGILDLTTLVTLLDGLPRSSKLVQRHK
ncbi:hypothetical protein CGMCC3_g15051 [Colletotrichum fructicola]|nr:uncharacterized protein CGMCC3_g15051 [Colletotrichum fructicola]KAE9568837.1 hypothetical protein CGMCC3_g15051 [Colletotrichum fructicola]